MKLNGKKILSYIFILVLFVGFVRTNPMVSMTSLATYLNQAVEEETTAAATTADANQKDLISVEDIEQQLVNSMSLKNSLIDFNGAMAKQMGMRGFYGDIGINLSEDGYIISASPYTTTDYEYEQTVDFAQFLQQNNINL